MSSTYLVKPDSTLDAEINQCDQWVINADQEAAAIDFTYAAATGVRHYVIQVIASYSAVQVGKRLTIIDDTNNAVVFDSFVTQSLEITFNPPLPMLTESSVKVTLGAGATGVSGFVTVRGFSVAPFNVA